MVPYYVLALRLSFYNQRLGEGTPTENQGGQSSSGGCGVNSGNGHLSTLRLPGELPGETGRRPPRQTRRPRRYALLVVQAGEEEEEEEEATMSLRCTIFEIFNV